MSLKGVRSLDSDMSRFIVHNTPSNSAGGGVGIYVKSDLKANKRMSSHLPMMILDNLG